MNPVVAVILGAIILQEPLTPRTVVASVVIVAAVVLIVTARGRVTTRVATVPARSADGAEPGSERGRGLTRAA